MQYVCAGVGKLGAAIKGPSTNLKPGGGGSVWNFLNSPKFSRPPFSTPALWHALGGRWGKEWLRFGTQSAGCVTQAAEQTVMFVLKRHLLHRQLKIASIKKGHRACEQAGKHMSAGMLRGSFLASGAHKGVCTTLTLPVCIAASAASITAVAGPTKTSHPWYQLPHALAKESNGNEGRPHCLTQALFMRAWQRV